MIVPLGGSNTMQIMDDNTPPPFHHVRARKASLPILAHAASICRPRPSLTQPVLTYVPDFLLSARVAFLSLVHPLATIRLGYVVHYT